MARMQNKKKFKIPRKLFSLPAVILLAIFCVVVIQGTFALYKKSKVAAQVIHNSEQDLSTLNERRVELQAKIDHFKSERGMEIETRKKFDLGQPGEKMFIVVEPENHQESSMVKSQFWILKKFREFIQSTF